MKRVLGLYIAFAGIRICPLAATAHEGQKRPNSPGPRDNTILIFTSDNGREIRQPRQGFSGPWAGTSFTGMEASLRVAFIIRWPGRVPAGAVNDDIVHEMDLFPTFAQITGGKVPQDRIIDGVDQTEFFMGKSSSKRESFVVYVGDQIFGVKWRDWKLMTKGLVRGTDPIEEWGHSRVINLLSNSMILLQVNLREPGGSA